MTDQRTDPPVGTTVSVIRSLLPSLVPSERRVATECVEHPEVVAMLSVADLATRTETSAATVIRTSKNLGFKGFQHLRLLLLRDVGSQSGPKPVDGSQDPRSSVWVPAMFDAVGRELSTSLGALDYEQFDAAAEALASARRVLIVANGGSGPIAQTLALRLIGVGRPCEAPYDAVAQQVSARLLSAGDVCLAISQTGLNNYTLHAVEAAGATGATIIGLTGYAKSRLSQLSNHQLVGGASFSAWGDDAVVLNVVQFLMVSALFTAVARRGGENIRIAASSSYDEVMKIVNTDPQDLR